jgi:hypothetical protein
LLVVVVVAVELQEAVALAVCLLAVWLLLVE